MPAMMAVFTSVVLLYRSRFDSGDHTSFALAVAICWNSGAPSAVPWMMTVCGASRPFDTSWSNSLREVSSTPSARWMT
jgi:hypothetical protein